MVFIDVWQGDSALLLLPGGEVVLIDGGDVDNGGSAVPAALDDEGIDAIDLVVLTHPHLDHYGGLLDVFATTAVGEVWEDGVGSDAATYADYEEARDATGAAVLSPEAGHTRSFGGVTLEVLATGTGYDDVNDESLVVMTTYGEVRILLGGDALADEQADLLEAHGAPGLGAQILKVPHHGSYNFDVDFPPSVAPRYAVFSCGEGNVYGHPHEEALAAYGGTGAALCRTDLLGDIVFTTDGAAIASSCD